MRGLVWVGFNALVLVLYPTVIAPLFNKFEPLRRRRRSPTRIDALLERIGFSSRGVFVMDGSKRSAHGNAYFTGLGRAKRIVFFDTLLQRLQPSEIEAVLAHELGHFKRRHIAKRLALSFRLEPGLPGGCWAGWRTQAWFYQGLGVTPPLDGSATASRWCCSSLVVPVFTFVLAAARQPHFAQARIRGRCLRGRAQPAATIWSARWSSCTRTTRRR